MQDVYKNIEEYNTRKESEILAVFDDMIDDMSSNKRLNPIVTEPFIKIKHFTFYHTIIFEGAKRR